MIVCYEAGYEGFWLHRRLGALGIRVVVIDPASLLVDRRAKRAKTDRIDARALVRALMAYMRGESQVLSEVRVPTAEQDDVRRVLRERQRLIQERTAHTNRIKGLLKTQGIMDFDPRAADAAARLDAIVTGDGRPLGACLKREIMRQLDRLALTMRHRIKGEPMVGFCEWCSAPVMSDGTLWGSAKMRPPHARRERALTGQDELL